MITNRKKSSLFLNNLKLHLFHPIGMRLPEFYQALFDVGEHVIIAHLFHLLNPYGNQFTAQIAVAGSYCSEFK
jgi:hypothetical protein